MEFHRNDMVCTSTSDKVCNEFPACAIHCLYPGLGVNELSFDGMVSFEAAETAPASSPCVVPFTNEVVDELPRRVDISVDFVESSVLLRFGVLVP